jgi:hypothetical protein
MLSVDALARGWSGIGLAYAAIQAPMMAAMIRRRAAIPRILLSPLIGVPLTVGAGLGIAAATSLLKVFGIGDAGVMQLILGAGMSAAIGYGAGSRLARENPPQSVHQRGALIRDADPRPEDGTAERLRHLGSSHHAASLRGSVGIGWERVGSHGVGLKHSSSHNTRPLTLAGVHVPHEDETKHFKLIGTTGTGKSTAIRELLDMALHRGDRAIIADPDAGYLSRFRSGDRNDVVLNPFDPSSLKWDLFGEIATAYDVEQLARSLIPDHGGSDRSWSAYARTFFSAVTRQAHEAGVTDLSELYRLLVVADASELRSFVAGTPAQPFLDPQNGRMFDSIRSVTSSAVGALEYVAEQEAPPLSIRQWVRGGQNSGVLFLPYRAGQIAALRSMISAWMRLAIFEAMSQQEGDQRLWFVVDELDALGQIDGLKDALARLRKFGGRCVLGFQSIAQVSSTYGAGEAQTLVENCGNTLILRCSGSEHGGTAHFASRLIGQREVLRTARSRSRRPTELLGSTTLSEHVAIEPAVMESQIEQLADLSGYLKLASHPEWQRVSLHARATAPIRSGAVQAWERWRNHRHLDEGDQHGTAVDLQQDRGLRLRHGLDRER